jgi:uncharacterized protein YggE
MSQPVIVLVLAVVGLAGPALAQVPPGPPCQPEDLVTTGGEGVILVAPDRAFVTLATESRARASKEAQRQNAEAMTSVQQRLRGLSLAADAVRTLSYDLQPEFDYAGGKQTLRGYVARNAIEVRVDEIARVGEVLDAAVASGATSVRDVRFDLKSRDTIELEALKRAVGQARARAEALAAAAGRDVDRIIRIEEQGGYTPSPRPMPMMRAEAAAMAAPAPPPPVEAGEIEVRARVTLTARMK